MVKKLYKHEFAAWLRVIAFFWAAVLITASVNRIVQIFETDNMIYKILFVSSCILYGISIAVTLAASTVFGIVRFYKNFFSGEGYLTFTLPATKKQLLFVKISTAVCISAISVVVCLLSGLIPMAGEVLTEVWKVVAYIFQDAPVDEVLQLVLLVLEYILWLLIATASGQFFYYLCICIGQLFKKNRVLAAVGVYFAFYMVSQAVATVFSIVFSIVVQLESFSLWVIEFGKWVNQHPMVFMHSGMWIGIALTFVGVLIDWAICHWVINKKLNLE